MQWGQHLARKVRVLTVKAPTLLDRRPVALSKLRLTLGFGFRVWVRVVGFRIRGLEAAGGLIEAEAHLRVRVRVRVRV